MLLLGYDIGSSSIKVALVDASDGKVLGTAQHPETEMPISSPHPDWAEQNPEDWWETACVATKKLLAKTLVSPKQIAAIGIAYQMHGLVVLDKAGQVLRPAIIWCDSRAVDIGNQAFAALGADYCLENYLNSPGNFTASKLRWIRENEPDNFGKIDKIMLPGDYIAYRMTGEICTTVTGLSEGVFWDYKANALSKRLLDYYQIPETMLPNIAPTFGQQGEVTVAAATALGLVPGIPIGYRAGDQPNNALSLNVLRPGEVAATGGTSGVVYAVSERPVFDPQQRVNSFAHVNYAAEKPLTGVLLCINGAGSLYRWVRENLSCPGLTTPSRLTSNYEDHIHQTTLSRLTSNYTDHIHQTTLSRLTSNYTDPIHQTTLSRQMNTYPEMEQLAATVPIGAEGLSILPFGNGAERMLGNQNPGAQVFGLQFNRHEPRHFFRAALEGIAFAFVYGMEAMREMGIPIHTLRVGNDNLFQSAIFSNTIATLMDVEIEVLDTTGAVGAAKAAGVSVGIFSSPEEALAQSLARVAAYSPAPQNHSDYATAYSGWRKVL